MGLSKKAEREQVRERLLRSGSSYAEVVDEMCRQFRVRPRTGWRYALGWEMWKVAQELVAANPKARVDVPRISRWESWPIGKGSSQPSLHDLAGLAMAFGHGCTVADLVDQADLAEFSPPSVVWWPRSSLARRLAVRVGLQCGWGTVPAKRWPPSPSGPSRRLRSGRPFPRRGRLVWPTSRR